MGDELDLIGNGGALKRIVREAPTDAIVPPKGPTLVDVHYKAVLPGIDEVVRDTSEEDNEAYSFRIGTGFVIKGSEIAVKTMKVGEIATITCKPDYTHGEGLPPNATLTFEVELVACRPHISASSGVAARPQEFEELDEAARDEIAKKRKAARDEIVKKREEAKKRKREEEVVHGEYDVTLDGGVLKKIIKKAEADAIDATRHSLVDVLYNGFVVKLETGQVLDFTFGDDSVLEDDTILGDDAISTFRMGGGSMMRGWDIALRTMKVGDIATITCKPNYAYGKEGLLPEIPPNATVISTLKLVACTPCESISAREVKRLRKGIAAAKRAEEKREEAVDASVVAAWKEKKAAAASVAAATAAAAAWKEKKAAAWKAAKAARMQAKLNAKGKRTSKFFSVFKSMLKWRHIYKI